MPLLLARGMVNKNHRHASKKYIEIGNPEIIDVRRTSRVKILGYGNIGEYVPFYFTPKSVMLYNIISGYRHPVVQKRDQSEILVVRCLIEELAELPRWFFTDGQGNDIATNHYNDLDSLDRVDWPCIQNSNFSKGEGDYDRPRRYQAEFLVSGEVPLARIESLNVYDQRTADRITQELANNNVNLPVNVQRQYFF